MDGDHEESQVDLEQDQDREYDQDREQAPETSGVVHRAFPSMTDSTLSPLPEGIKQQLKDYVPKQNLMEHFADYPTYYVPKKLDPWVKLGTEDKAIDALLQGVEFTIALAFGPVMCLRPSRQIP